MDRATTTEHGSCYFERVRVTLRGQQPSYAVRCVYIYEYICASRLVSTVTCNLFLVRLVSGLDARAPRAAARTAGSRRAAPRPPGAHEM